MRAESKFTFKPDELSDEPQMSQRDDFDIEEDGLLSDGLLGEQNRPETSLHFFAREFREKLEQDFADLKSSMLK